MAYRETPAVRRRLDAARDRLVAEATDVVAEVGWAGASVTVVAAAAGMSAGSVYQHFASKTALAVEVFRRASGREVEVLAEVLRESGGGPAERLAHGVEVFARRALERRGLAYALLAAPADAAVGAERLEYRRRYRALFAEVVGEGVAAGSLPPQDPEITAAALTGAVGEVLIDPLAGPSDHPERLVAELRAMSLRCAGAAAPAADGPAAIAPAAPVRATPSRRAARPRPDLPTPAEAARPADAADDGWSPR